MARKKPKQALSLSFDIPPEVWATIIMRLVQLGWLAWSKQVKITPQSAAKLVDVHWEAIRRAIRKYQSWASLLPDEYPGPVTQHSLFQPRICGTPDSVQAVGEPCKWPHKEITYSVLGTLPGVGDADFKAAAERAAKQWDDACGVGMFYKVNLRTANVILTVADLGGPGGVLADSMLPCGAAANDVMQQRYDSREIWFAGEGPPLQGRIHLEAVIAHEMGHALGLPHLAPNGPVALMQPFYRGDILRIQPPDAAEVVTRYGANTPPSPPPPPPPPGDPPVRYRIKGTNIAVDVMTLEPLPLPHVARI